jgi:hypothetical protein
MMAAFMSMQGRRRSEKFFFFFSFGFCIIPSLLLLLPALFCCCKAYHSAQALLSAYLQAASYLRLSVRLFVAGLGARACLLLLGFFLASIPLHIAFVFFYSCGLFPFQSFLPVSYSCYLRG